MKPKLVNIYKFHLSPTRADCSASYRAVFVSLFCLERVSLFLGCQYQRNRLPGKTRLRNDLLGCVEWTLNNTHSLTQTQEQQSFTISQVAAD